MGGREEAHGQANFTPDRRFCVLMKSAGQSQLGCANLGDLSRILIKFSNVARTRRVAVDAHEQQHIRRLLEVTWRRDVVRWIWVLH